MYLCLRGVDFGSFYDFDLGTVPTVWYFITHHTDHIQL